MANSKKVDEVVVKVPQGVKTIKIEIAGNASNEGVTTKSTRKKICD